MIFNCMYGAAHPGNAVVVRSKMGKSLGGLCDAHHTQHHKTLEERGYHFRTYTELAVRGDLKDGEGQPQPAAKSVDQVGATEQQFAEHEYPGWDTEISEPPPELHAPRDLRGQSHGGAEAGRLADSGRHAPTDSARPAAQELATVPSRETASGERLPGQVNGTQAVVTPEWPAWTEGAGHLLLTQEQRHLLQMPFNDDEITIRYDGVVYAPWRRYWSRMCAAFAPHVPSVIPVDNPRFQGTEIVVGVVMVVDGRFIGKAWGSHRLEGPNDRMSVGDRIESAISDAIAKIGKRLNMGEELWDEEFRNYWKSQYAEEYSNGRRTSWRRKPVTHVEEHE